MRDDARPAYRFADVVVASDLALPELAPSDGRPAAWRVRMAPPGASPPSMTRMHEWRDSDGSRSAWFGRVEDRFVLHFARTAAFVADPRAGEITCHPIGRAGAASIRPVLLNQVLPLLLGQTRLVLHASAVADDLGAVVFAGPPGRGKSTLAMSLATVGYQLMTDDVLVVDQGRGEPRAVPSGLEARLWPDSLHAVLSDTGRRWSGARPRTTKKRIQPEMAGLVTASLPVRLRRIYLLAEPGDLIAIAPLPFAEAATLLTGTAFLLEVDRADQVRQAFEWVTSLLSHVPVRRLTPTRSLDDLAPLRAAVVADLAASVPRAS